jgi:hypothetical protein
MKKLMVAGCSFSAVSKQLPGTSWSEVLARQLGDWDLVNLAREGCSNGGVRIQIEEILRQRPDFAIITPTFWDRMEIPSRAAPYDWEQTRTAWDPPLQRHLQDRTLKNGYDRTAGIDNVNYGNNPYRMICETIFTLAENFPNQYRHGNINKSTQTAVKHYIDQIYDSNWKKQQDEWIIREGIMQLYLADIPFIVVPVLLWPFDPDIQTQWRNAFPKTLIPDHYVMLDEKQSPLHIAGHNGFEGEDPGYHSSPRGQEIIAENWFERIRRDFPIA